MPDRQIGDCAYRARYIEVRIVFAIQVGLIVDLPFGRKRVRDRKQPIAGVLRIDERNLSRDARNCPWCRFILRAMQMDNTGAIGNQAGNRGRDNGRPRCAI